MKSIIKTILIAVLVLLCIFFVFGVQSGFFSGNPKHVDSDKSNDDYQTSSNIADYEEGGVESAAFHLLAERDPRVRIFVENLKLSEREAENILKDSPFWEEKERYHWIYVVSWTAKHAEKMYKDGELVFFIPESVSKKEQKSALTCFVKYLEKTYCFEDLW
ncbi:hypothetical protein ACFL15_01570 [Patescibacteria group bacterium]